MWQDLKPCRMKCHKSVNSDKRSSRPHWTAGTDTTRHWKDLRKFWLKERSRWRGERPWMWLGLRVLMSRSRRYRCGNDQILISLYSFYRKSSTEVMRTTKIVSLGNVVWCIIIFLELTWKEKCDNQNWESLFLTNIKESLWKLTFVTRMVLTWRLQNYSKKRT